MKPATCRRASTILAADLAACSAVAMAIASTRPVLALGILAGINTAAAAALPAPGMAWAQRLGGRALRAARAWTRHPPPPDPQTGHAAWMARVRAIADEQRTARVTGCLDGFCACGIPRADLERFRDQVELIAWEMRQQERRRRW